MDFKTKQKIYNECFSLGNLNCTFTEKMALISLICYIKQQLSKKKPDVTYYQVIQKFNTPTSIPEEVVQALAIICEDFAYGVKDFPTFDLKSKEMVAKIKEILARYLPF